MSIRSFVCGGAEWRHGVPISGIPVLLCLTVESPASCLSLTVMIAMQFVVNDIQSDFLDIGPQEEQILMNDKIEEYSDEFEACDLRWSDTSLTDCSNMCYSCLEAFLILRTSLCIIDVRRCNYETELDAGNCWWNLTMSESVRICFYSAMSSLEHHQALQDHP
jgi:hypothetical protein